MEEAEEEEGEAEAGWAVGGLGTGMKAPSDCSPSRQREELEDGL